MTRGLFASRTLLLAVLCLPLTAFAGLMEDMVAFDRAYIPALAVTNAGSLPQSQRAMEQLNREWSSFKKQHASAKRNDKKWTADFAEIDRMIAEASKLVAAGADVHKAHEALEGVRSTFVEMRVRLKMPYYLDPLAHFHDTMEEITLLAEDQTPATLGAEQTAKLKAALVEAETRWAAVKASRVGPEFGVNAEQKQQLEQFLAGQTAALDTLKQALAGGDKAAQLSAARGIKPAFAKIYMFFGNFAPVRR